MIEIKHLSKRYNKIEALQDINLSLSKDEIVFLVGPNGAGKSTLMRLLCGYAEPSEGEVLLADHNIQTDRTLLSYLGYVPENSPLYPEMNVYEYIKYVAGLWQLDKKRFEQRLRLVVDKLQLAEVLTQRIDTLSKGFRRRVGIAGALIHNPEILILDEPTEGLDPNQKHQIHQFVREYAKNRLIIVSSHLMEEVEAIADRVILINKGKLVWDGTPGELKSVAPDRRLDTAFRLLTGGEER